MDSKRLKIVVLVCGVFALLAWHNTTSAATIQGGNSGSYPIEDPEQGFTAPEVWFENGFQAWTANLSYTTYLINGTDTSASSICFFSHANPGVEPLCFDGSLQGAGPGDDKANYDAAMGAGYFSCTGCAAPVEQGFTGYNFNVEGRKASVDIPAQDETRQVQVGEQFSVDWKTNWATSGNNSPRVSVSGPVSGCSNGSLDQGSIDEQGTINCTATGTGTITIKITAEGPGPGAYTVDTRTITIQVGQGGSAPGAPGSFTLSGSAQCSADGNNTAVNLSWTPSSGVSTYDVIQTSPGYGIPNSTGLSAGTTSFNYPERKGSDTLYYKVRAVNSQGSTDSNEISVLECPRPVVTLSANPTEVSYNTASTLSYSSQNAYVCNILGGSLNQSITPNTSGTLGTGSLIANTTFTFTCSDPDGGYADTASAAVTVGSPPPGSYRLTVNKTGNGTVTSNPGGINCGSTCSVNFTDGTTLTLTASPDAGWSIGSWSGGSCSGSGSSCTLTISSNITVAVIFTENPVVASPRCSSATPDDDTIYTSQPTRRTYANGVENSSAVYFPTWLAGQDSSTAIWHQGAILSGSTWYVDIPMSSHPGTGGFNVHIWLYNDSAGMTWCDSANFNVAAPSGLVFGITYTPGTLNTPTNVGVDNTVCQKITTNWSYTNNGVENGFYVYRSTDNTNWGSPISALLSTATRSYQDTPPQTNVRFYYRVSAHRAQSLDPREVYSVSANAMNLNCVANVTVSNALDKVNGATYNNSGKIAAGDTLTYKITIINNGPANAAVNLICNDVSSNLTNVRNLTVSGNGANNGGISQNNATCVSAGYSGLRFNVSGNKDVPNNWLITFDATFSPAASQSQESVSEKACVNFTDSTSKWSCGTAPSIIVNTANQAPIFREVAP